MSSVDGDEAAGSSHHEDDESVDGDDGPEAPVPRVRGRAKAPAAPAPAPAAEFRKKGSLMIFLILASAGGLWSQDLQELDLHSWTDVIYGGPLRQASLVGAVVGTWEYVAGDSLNTDTDESIFIDMAKLTGGGKYGMLVYRAVQSIVLHSAHAECDYPITSFRLLQKFGSYLCKLYGAAETAPMKPFNDFIKQFKLEHSIAASQIHVCRFCPKAAWMAVNGWKFFHAVAVSKKFSGTQILGTTKTS